MKLFKIAVNYGIETEVIALPFSAKLLFIPSETYERVPKFLEFQFICFWCVVTIGEPFQL